VPVNVGPAQLQRLAEPGAGIDEKHAQPVAVLGAVADPGEEQRLFRLVEEADAAGPLFLSAKFREAMDIAHLVSLAEQLSQRRKFPVDGRVAVSAFAQPADQEVEHVLPEHAEFLAEQELVQLTDEEGDVILMRSVLPKKIAVFSEQLAQAVFRNHTEPRRSIRLVFHIVN
jgi:hypothetical protein